MTQTSIAWWARAYQSIFKRIARIRLHRADIDPAVIHTHLITVLSTSVLMWFYAIVACCTISNPWPGIIGLVASFLHLLSPWLFRYTANGLLVCSGTLACGMVHQLTFTIYSGGFSSSIVVWLAILPMLAGLIVGRHAALLWFALTMLGSGTLFVIELIGINLPMAITPTGKLMAHAGLVFGWITMSLIMSWVHISAWKAKQQLSEWQRIRAEELYRALFHDLSSPVGNIELSLSDIKTEDRALQIAAVARVEKSLQTLRGIVGGARLLYALDRGLVMVGSAVANLSEVIAVAANQLRPQVEEKEQQLVILIDELAGVQIAGDSNVLAQHVLMNVLTNAVKYSPRKSTITIDVTMDDKQINVHIRDQGAGMNREQLQSLTQAQGFTVRKETTGELGHGFGLQLARAFLIRYGGTISIASNQATGTGTCVSLHFPRNIS